LPRAAEVMRLDRDLRKALAVPQGRAAGLSSRTTSGAQLLADKAAGKELHGFTTELAAAQELLYAAGSAAVLVIFQGLDAAGKDGSIKHVMSGVNPQGCSVASFKQPSQEELSHDFLWRAAARLPARGSIGIFNRSYYEDVLVVRVHPELLAPQHLRAGATPAASFWHHRFADINAFERHLHRNGTKVVKFFLHLSRQEQRRRLLERLDDPAKHWKFSAADLAERAYWDAYQAAYEDALTATSTQRAPWYVIPADDKHVARALIAGLILHAIDGLALNPPVPTRQQEAEIKAAKKQLRAE
jgi:PPK2 family polyphosphate:nucleotide phosphotransferase